MAADKTTREFRLEFLKDRMKDPIPLEDLLDNEFPNSVLHSAYWSSAAPGGRLAFELGTRVFFSRKFAHIQLIPMTWNEQKTAERRIELSRQRANDKNENTRQIVREMRAARLRAEDRAKQTVAVIEDDSDIPQE